MNNRPVEPLRGSPVNYVALPGISCSYAAFAIPSGFCNELRFRLPISCPDGTKSAYGGVNPNAKGIED